MGLLERIFGTEVEKREELSEKEDFIKKFERLCVSSGGQFKKKGNELICVKEKEVKNTKKIEMELGEPVILLSIVGDKDKFDLEYIMPEILDFKLSGDDIKELSFTDRGVEIKLKQPISAKIKGILKGNVNEPYLPEFIESDFKWKIAWKKEEGT